MKSPDIKRILVVSAGFDPVLNEMSEVWQHIADTCNVDVCAIAPGNDPLKGSRQAIGSRQSGRLAMHWVERQFPLAYDDTISAIARDFRPDTVFTGPRDQLACGLAIGAATGARVALHAEFFFDDRHWVRRREYLGLSALRPWAGNRVRRKVLGQAYRVFVSDPSEQARFAGHPGLRFLPWPHRPPGAGVTAAPADARRNDELLYIGSLFRAKGAARLADWFCAALAAMPELNVRLIGPVIDDDARQAHQRIRAAAGSRFSWTASVPRDEALTLIGQSFCAISPGDTHGWGQIADAWHLRTPVIAAGEHYELKAGHNCLVAADPQAFVDAIRALRDDPALRERLTEAGRRSIDGYSVTRTADALWRGLQD